MTAVSPSILNGMPPPGLRNLLLISIRKQMDAFSSIELRGSNGPCSPLIGLNPPTALNRSESHLVNPHVALYLFKAAQGKTNCC